MNMAIPVINGYEATRRIRKIETQNAENGVSRRIPIIALTARAFEDEKEDILVAGCDGFISK